MWTADPQLKAKLSTKESMIELVVATRQNILKMCITFEELPLTYQWPSNSKCY
jgi:hypothetical protein